MSGMVDATGLMLCVACGENIEHEPDNHHCDPKEKRVEDIYAIDTGRTFSDRLGDAELLRRDD